MAEQFRKALETAQSFLVNQRPAPAIKLGQFVNSLCVGQVAHTFRSLALETYYPEDMCVSRKDHMGTE